MSFDGSPLPEESGHRLPPPRPPRTAVGALPPDRRPPIGRTRAWGSLRPIALGPFVRRTLWPAAALVGIGGLLRFLSDTPAYRDFGAAMAVTGISYAALVALIVAALRYNVRP